MRFFNVVFYLASAFAIGLAAPIVSVHSYYKLECTRHLIIILTSRIMTLEVLCVILIFLGSGEF